MTDSKINQKRGRPSRSEDEIRKAIRETAIKVLLQQGYSATTIDDVAKQAGMAKKTLYRFIKNKDDLVEQIVLSWTDRFIAIFNDNATDFNDFIRLLAEQLNTITQTILSQEAVGLFKLLQEEFPHREILMEKYQNNGILRSRNLLTQWLQQQEKNHIINTCDFAVMSDLLLAMIVAEPLRQIALGIIPPAPETNFNQRIQDALCLITPKLKP